MSWSEGDSRVCVHCGKPLRITDQQALWIHTEAGKHTSSHVACGPPWPTGSSSTSTAGSPSTRGGSTGPTDTEGEK